MNSNTILHKPEQNGSVLTNESISLWSHVRELMTTISEMTLRLAFYS